MGSYGSGRNARGAPRSEQFHKLDLAGFPRRWFEDRRAGTLTWSRGGHKTGSIGYRLSPASMRLIYTIKRQGEPVEIDETFQLAFTEQPFGGVRGWIECKGCERRCRVLYGGAHFRCRQCCRLTYESQYERIYAPGVTRTMRVRQKLNGEPGLAYPFPDRPKGMHWRTYLRLREADWAASARLDALLMQDVLRWRRR